MKENLKQSNMVGHCKVSTFKDGKVTNVMEKDNFITKFGLEMLKRRQAMLVGSRITGVGSDSIDTSLHLNSYDPFGRLLLSTSDDPSRPESDVFLWGEVVASAQRRTPYSGEDEMLGTINPEETTVSASKTKLVFDFPTHSANGTFQSLGFVDGGVDISKTEFGLIKLSDVIGMVYSSGGVNKGRLRLYRSGQAINTIIDLETGVVDAWTETGDNSYCYVMFSSCDITYTSRNKDGNKFYKMEDDLKTVTEEEFVFDKEIPSIAKVFDANVAGIDYLFVQSSSGAVDEYNDNPYHENLYKFSAEGEFIEAIKLPSYSNSFRSNLNSIQLSGDTLYLDLSTKHIYNLESGEFKATANLGDNLARYDGKLIRADRDVVYEVFPSTLMTKIVLDEPVTKLPTETMKIEYTFTY